MDDLSSISNKFRLVGYATGLDTDSMVKQLMKVEQIPLDKLKQNRQILEWKRDSYRDITNLLRGFKDDFFEILKPDTNMMSTAAYKKFTASSSSTLITASADSSASAGIHNITVQQVATAASAESTSSVTKDLVATLTSTDFTVNNQFNITLNGVTKTIALTNKDYGNAAALVGDPDGLQALVDNAFGAGKITVTAGTDPVSGKDTVAFITVSGKISLLDASSNNALPNLGFNSGQSNRLNQYDTLASLSLKTGLAFDGSGKLNFTINNVSFSIDQNATLYDMMNQINTSSAGVSISYSELDDKFNLTSKLKGSGDNIVITGLDSSIASGNLFGAGSAINITQTVINNGTDARFDLDGVNNIIRNDNNFTIDGITYQISPNITVPQTATVTVAQDTDAIFNNIKSFVDKYNDLITKINGELSEEQYRDYQPLTDDQKAAMSETDITKWENKAKSGLLRNDSILEKITSSMRQSISDAVSGVAGDLSQIGISTANWWDNGKLVIDETKLRAAIQNNPTQVQNLFSKQSTISYSPDLTSADRTQRYNEEGIANRLSDIIQDNIRITRNTNGQKGTLLEKAGLVGDFTEFKNTITDQINDDDTRINALIERLVQKEEGYYKKFAALETAMNQLNSQSSWLASQLGSLGGGR